MAIEQTHQSAADRAEHAAAAIGLDETAEALKKRADRRAGRRRHRRRITRCRLDGVYPTLAGIDSVVIYNQEIDETTGMIVQFASLASPRFTPIYPTSFDPARARSN